MKILKVLMVLLHQVVVQARCGCGISVQAMRDLICRLSLLWGRWFMSNSTQIGLIGRLQVQEMFTGLAIHFRQPGLKQETHIRMLVT